MPILKKRLFLFLLLTSFLGAAAGQAANPFADVEPDHWSYRAVKELVDAGLVDDYSNSMLQKNRRIARYALAQLAGQAIYRIGEATPEQKPLIRRLAAEYRTDLERMGAPPMFEEENSALPATAVRENDIKESASGAKNIKISGFLQTENSYGQRYNPQDPDHEYELEMRLKIEKKISEKLSYTHEIQTKTYFDDYSAAANDNLGYEYPSGNREKVYTRQAYLTWRPNENSGAQAGKFAVWLAGGLLADDYVKGALLDFKTKDHLRFIFLASRYSANADWPGMAVVGDGAGGYTLKRGTTDRNVWYAGASKRFGAADVGVHYLSADSSFVANEHSAIYAATVDAQWQKIDWSLGYAQNVEADDDNELYKLQMAKNFGKDSLILQYWRSEQNINLPVEHGNHTAFWTDTYSARGLRGLRVIYVFKFNDNLLLETFYGRYKSLVRKEDAAKYGFAATVAF